MREKIKTQIRVEVDSQLEYILGDRYWTSAGDVFKRRVADIAKEVMRQPTEEEYAEMRARDDRRRQLQLKMDVVAKSLEDISTGPDRYLLEQELRRLTFQFLEDGPEA